jgi:hypothetical protein
MKRKFVSIADFLHMGKTCNINETRYFSYGLEFVILLLHSEHPEVIWSTMNIINQDSLLSRALVSRVTETICMQIRLWIHRFLRSLMQRPVSFELSSLRDSESNFLGRRVSCCCYTLQQGLPFACVTQQLRLLYHTHTDEMRY